MDCSKHVQNILNHQIANLGPHFDYLMKTLDQRLSTGCGSITGFNTRLECFKALINAEWMPYVHENIAEGCEAFVTYDIAGYLGVVNLNTVPESVEGTLVDYKGTGTLSLVLNDYSRQFVNYTVLIIGEDEGEDIMFTFHPGAPLQASEFKSGSKEEGGSGFKDGDKITVGEAKKLGFKHAKIGVKEITMSDIDQGIQDYVKHVKEFEAPRSSEECIRFINENYNFDVVILNKMENKIATKMEEYYGN